MHSRTPSDVRWEFGATSPDFRLDEETIRLTCTGTAGSIGARGHSNVES